MRAEVTKALRSLKTPIALLMGGRSAERPISLQSGEAVARALDSLKIAYERIDPVDDHWLTRMTDRFSFAFNALHGVGGEDGTVQGALESIGVAYTGSGVMASALAMDKLRCKQLWRGIQLPTPEFVVLNANADWQGIIDAMTTVMVKPAHEGSSIGMAKVSNATDLADAYRNACRYDASVIAEKWITGSEYTVAVLAGKTLPAIRLQTKRGFYDYDAKYIDDDTEYLLPCGLDDQKLNELNDLALAAFESIGCRGWGRIDFMQDAAGQFYILEVNTVPGMTSHSLVPMAARAAGLDFNNLVAEIVTDALLRRGVQ